MVNHYSRLLNREGRSAALHEAHRADARYPALASVLLGRFPPYWQLVAIGAKAGKCRNQASQGHRA